MVTTPLSHAHHVSSQRASVTLIISSDGTIDSFEGVVTRITPWNIRLAISRPIPADPRDIYRWNPVVRIQLALPQPLESVTTTGKITGLAMNFDKEQPPVVFDLDFPDITEEQEQALRDSNPMLVVA